MRWRLQLEFFPLQTFGSNRYFFLKHLNWNSLKFAPPELQRGVRSWLKFFLQCSVVTCWNTPSLAMVLHFVELLLLTLWSCSYQCTDAAEMYFVARLPLESQHQNLKCHSRQLQLPCETPSYQSTENLRGRGTRELAGGSWGALICSVGVMSLRHMSATQSGSCEEVPEGSFKNALCSFARPFFVVFWFCLYCLCMFVCFCAGTVEHMFTCNVLHEASMAKWMQHT